MNTVVRAKCKALPNDMVYEGTDFWDFAAHYFQKNENMNILQDSA